MHAIKYRLWIGSDVINAWINLDQAREDVRTYIEANPDEAHLLHFGAFRSGYHDQPAKPVFTVSGQELVDYLNDVAQDEEWDS